MASMATWVLRRVLGNQTLVLMFAWQKLCPLNHLTGSHAVILLRKQMLTIVCPLLEIKTSYAYARQELLPLSYTPRSKSLSNKW